METKITIKEYLLLGVSYLSSKVLQFIFKCRVYMNGLPFSKDKMTSITNRWSTINPFSGDETAGKWYSTYYWDPNKYVWDKVGGRYLYGTFSHSFKAKWLGELSKNPCLWMLEMDHGKLQELDIVEFMGEGDKRGCYFSIYNNEVSNRYYYDGDKSRIAYRRFQTRMRSPWIMDYLAGHKVSYSVKWDKNKVVWYIGGLPVAISFVYVPSQPMYIILNNLK
jgi:hypothetical protein